MESSKVEGPFCASSSFSPGIDDSKHEGGNPLHAVFVKAGVFAGFSSFYLVHQGYVMIPRQRRGVKASLHSIHRRLER